MRLWSVFWVLLVLLLAGPPMLDLLAVPLHGGPSFIEQVRGCRSDRPADRGPP